MSMRGELCFMKSIGALIQRYSFIFSSRRWPDVSVCKLEWLLADWVVVVG